MLSSQHTRGNQGIREVNQLAKDYVAFKWNSQNLDLGNLTSEPVLITTLFYYLLSGVVCFFFFPAQHDSLPLTSFRKRTDSPKKSEFMAHGESVIIRHPLGHKDWSMDTCFKLNQLKTLPKIFLTRNGEKDCFSSLVRRVQRCKVMVQFRGENPRIKGENEPKLRE